MHDLVNQLFGILWFHSVEEESKHARITTDLWNCDSCIRQPLCHHKEDNCRYCTHERPSWRPGSTKDTYSIQ